MATITGMSFTKMPYTSQSNTPKQKKENIPSERSLAEPLFQVFNTCGKKAMVVHDPAANPSICISFMVSKSYSKVTQKPLKGCLDVMLLALGNFKSIAEKY